MPLKSSIIKRTEVILHPYKQGNIMGIEDIVTVFPICSLFAQRQGRWITFIIKIGSTPIERIYRRHHFDSKKKCDYLSRVQGELIVNRTIPSDLGDIGIWQAENELGVLKSGLVRDLAD